MFSSQWPLQIAENVHLKKCKSDKLCLCICFNQRAGGWECEEVAVLYLEDGPLLILKDNIGKIVYEKGEDSFFMISILNPNHL